MEYKSQILTVLQYGTGFFFFQIWFYYLQWKKWKCIGCRKNITCYWTLSASHTGLVEFCTDLSVKAGGSEPLDSRGGHKVWMRKWEVVVPVCRGYYSSLHHRLNIGSALKGLSFSRASKVPK